MSETSEFDFSALKRQAENIAERVLPRHSDVQYLKFALRLALPCCIIAKRVKKILNGTTTATKSDSSPVTAGDLAIQATAAYLLSRFSQKFNDFPGRLVAEEDLDSVPLHLVEVVLKVLNQCVNKKTLTELFPELADVFEKQSIWSAETLTESHAKTVIKSDAELLSLGTAKALKRRLFWVLDPIDGTKGFLREGGQYAVALALIDYDTGKPVLGLLGCPNLPTQTGATAKESGAERGVIAFAAATRGSFSISLEDVFRSRLNIHGDLNFSISPLRTYVSQIKNPENLTLVESFEKAHTAHSLSARVMEICRVTPHNIANPVRLDSQAKYAMIARGEGSLLLRFPRPGYRECVWDHAAGSIVVEEAGGAVVHADGESLRFTKLRFDNNTGIIACGTSRDLVPTILNAVKLAKQDNMCTTADF